jgi:hypothetical protein
MFVMRLFLLLQHFITTIARLLLPVDGAHAACCEEMAASMSNAEAAALKGLQLCIDIVIVEVSMEINIHIWYDVPNRVGFSFHKPMMIRHAWSKESKCCTPGDGFPFGNRSFFVLLKSHYCKTVLL